MEFATESTITYAGALFTTAFAIPILGERVGWMRWGEVIVGFVGVSFILQPSNGAFSFFLILPLAAAALYALLMITAKLFDDGDLVLYHICTLPLFEQVAPQS